MGNSAIVFFPGSCLALITLVFECFPNIKWLVWNTHCFASWSQQ